MKIILGISFTKVFLSEFFFNEVNGISYLLFKILEVNLTKLLNIKDKF